MKTILFVCVHNAGRSQMAEAFVNHVARQKGLPVRGASAGTVVGKGLNPAAVEVMAELGISMEGHQPKLIDQQMVDQADKVISMGCGVDVEACPARVILTEDWDLQDPAGEGLDKVRAIRDDIRQRVDALLQEMSRD